MTGVQGRSRSKIGGPVGNDQVSPAGGGGGGGARWAEELCPDLLRRVARAGRGCSLAPRVDGPVALVEVLGAVGADAPLGADEVRARGAHPLEPRAARRTEDVVLLHALVAGRAHDPLLGLRPG